MQTPNENGVYPTELTEELARHGRAYAAVDFCQCEDGLYRYSLDMGYSHGGFCGPIYGGDAGYATIGAARDAALKELLQRFPRPYGSEPQGVHDELRDLLAKIEAGFRQPSLF